MRVVSYYPLRRDLLPKDEPRLEMAHMNTVYELCFGVLATPPLSSFPGETVNEHGVAQTCYMVSEINTLQYWPELDYTTFQEPAIPAGWKGNHVSYDEETNIAHFVGFNVEIKHGLKLNKKSQVSEAILLLLSGYLQTGEEINFRNYMKYVKLRELTFLPLTIHKNWYRFHTFPQTLASRQQGVETCKVVLEKMGAIGPKLLEAARLAYAIVRLDEIRQASPSLMNTTGPAIRDAQLQFRDLFGEHRQTLSFVYTGMKGSKKSRRFTYEMYQKHVRVELD